MIVEYYFLSHDLRMQQSGTGERKTELTPS